MLPLILISKLNLGTVGNQEAQKNKSLQKLEEKVVAI